MHLYRAPEQYRVCTTSALSAGTRCSEDARFKYRYISRARKEKCTRFLCRWNWCNIPTESGILSEIFHDFEGGLFALAYWLRESPLSLSILASWALIRWCMQTYSYSIASTVRFSNTGKQIVSYTLSEYKISMWSVESVELAQNANGITQWNLIGKIIAKIEKLITSPE